MTRRVFYVASGPGDLIAAHRSWRDGAHHPTEVAVTYSGQFEDFCEDIGAEAYLVSAHSRREVLKDGRFTIEHLPKPARQGIRFHLAQFAYGLRLLARAVRFRADVALISSGCTHYFGLTLFRICGIRVIPVLHNALWPAGFPPARVLPRILLALDAFFWRRVPHSAVVVSPECERQIDAVRGTRTYPIFQTRAQFRREFFARIPEPPPHQQRPFRVVFVGRIDRGKGVFDILQIARKIEDIHAGLVRWEICGEGPDLEQAKRVHRELALQDVVVLRGWTSPEEQIAVYARSHACIVPTRSSFTEGLAKTAVESILSGRPLVTNPASHALDVLGPACYAARTDDPDSHMQAVLALARDPALYEKLRLACRTLQQDFYDRRLGLAAVLKAAVLGRPAPAEPERRCHES